MNEISRKKALSISNEILLNLDKCISIKDTKPIIKVFEKYGLVKPEIEKDIQLKGQMNIFDYPEYCPDTIDEEIER